MASILETFAVLFSGDNKDLADAAKESEKIMDDLESKVEETDEVTEALGKSFSGLIKDAKGAIVSVLGLGATTASLIYSAQMTDQLGKFSQVLDLNIQDVDAWSEAVIRSGGTAQGFQSTISSLTNQLTDFVLTGGGQAGEVFARLGIQAFDATGQIKNAFDLLPEIADAFSQLSAAESVGFGQKLGLDQGTILLLQQGRREVDALVKRQRELGVVTEKDAEIAAKFNDAWADFSQKTARSVNRLGAIVLPVVTNIFNSIDGGIQFLKDNQTIIEGFFIGVAGVIAAAYLPAIISAAIATLAVAAPFILIAGLIAGIGAAFALIYEDIVAFNNGQDSLLGLAVEKWPILGKIIDGVKDSFQGLKEVAMAVLDAITKILSGDFSILTDIFSSIKDIGSDTLENILGDATAALSVVDNNPLAGQTSNSIVNQNTANRTTSLSVGNVAVDARGGDSREIASGIGSALSNEMRKAISNFDDGVLA